MSNDYVTIPDLTNLASGLESTDDMVIYDASASDTKRVGLDVLSTFFSGGGGSGDVTEFIQHTSAGAISPTAPVVVVIAQANVTLPNVTDTPRLIAIISGGGAYTITCDSGDYIYTVSSNLTSFALANKEVLVLFSTDTTANAWVPIAHIADVSSI